MTPLGMSIWPTPVSGGPIRITTYEFNTLTSPFSGTTYEMTLLDNLQTNYFVMMSGHYDVVGVNGAAASFARVRTDPFGTGGLNTSSGPNKLGLQRDQTGLNDWVGSVTVVEAIDVNADTFTLLDVVNGSFAASPGASPQDITATSSAWSDINQVVCFGGHRGGGAELNGAGGNEYRECYCRVWPSSTTTVNMRRRAQVNLSAYSALEVCCYVVEWGANWDVQRVNVTGNNAGPGVNATGEYDTGAISSTVRDNTWVWASGTHDQGSANVDGHATASVVTLGDGVNQNASETSVAVGSEVDVGGVGKDVEVYVMEHADLAVDYRFHADADDSDPYSQTVDGTTSTESYDEVSNPRTTQGARFGLVYGSFDPTGSDHWKAIHWQRHTADTTLRIRRMASGYSWAGWVQSVDFIDVGA